MLKKKKKKEDVSYSSTLGPYSVLQKKDDFFFLSGAAQTLMRKNQKTIQMCKM